MAYVRRGAATSLTLLTLCLLLPVTLAEPVPPPAPPGSDAGFTGGGARIGLTRDQSIRLVSAGEKPGQIYEYVSISYCASDPTDPARDILCTEAFAVCASNTPEQGLGPANKIFRRSDVEPTWEGRGTTCFPDLVDDGPTLTMAMILEAFHDTAFAVPTVSIQPKGDVTLVTLPTYYEVLFPAAGYEPGEIDTTDIIGFSVDIRPRLDAVTYHFGDGSTIGPTTDLGGPFPTGGIVHVYADTGAVQARADVVYGGQFRVNGGGWTDIPGTATITGAPTEITVKESRARLVTGGD